MITRDEWLHALGEASLPNPDALTVKELATLYGFNRRTMGERVNRLVEQGKAERVVTVREGRRLYGYLLTKKGKR